MAKRNPDWSTDELLLAIDLYRRLGPLGDEHPEVKSLSALLRAANPTAASENDSFRNPAGVSMKLQNIRYVDTNGAIGFVGGGKLERELWEILSPEFAKLTSMAGAIRAHITAGASLDRSQDDVSDDTFEAFEGRILSYAHFRRERDAKLRRRKIENIRAKGLRLDCEACGFNFEDAYGERGADFIEVHHTVSLASLSTDGAKTSLSDLRLVCSNCHRMIHARKPWLSLDELKKLLTE